MRNKTWTIILTLWVAFLATASASDSLCAGVEYNRFVRDPSSCARYFLCRNDRAFPGTCRDEMHFDYPTQMCRYPDFVDCDPSDITIDPPTTTPDGPIENWICRERPHNSFCADPRRCGSYFLCQHGIGRPGNCPRRTWFHPLFYFCTNPGGFCTPRDRCDNGMDNNGRECEDDREPTSTTTEIATTTPSGPIEAWVCIGVLDNSFRRHPHLCGAFFICRLQVGQLGNCPRRQWFNPNSNTCTIAGAFCVPREPCDNGIDGNGNQCEGDRDTTTTVATTTTTEVTTTPSGPIEVWVCIGAIDNSFRRHPHMCGGYFVCRSQRGIFAWCPRRSWFNFDLSICTNPGPFCTPPNQGCDNGVTGNGQHCEDDTTTTITTTPSTTTTTVATTTPSGPIYLWICIGVRHQSFTRHPGQCGSFFFCVNQIGFPGRCPRNFWFHPVLHICTSPGNFCTPNETCDNGVGQNCPDSSEESSESGSKESNSNESRDCSKSGSSSSSDSSESNDSRCDSRESGENPGTTPSGELETWVCQGMANLDVTPHPEQCGTFFLCMYEHGLPVQCPNLQWFNPRTRLCEDAGNFCTTSLPCDNGVGDCSNVSTDDPLIEPDHSSTVRF